MIHSSKLLSTDNKDTILTITREILEESSSIKRGTLLPVVKKMLSKKKSFLDLAKKQKPPFYILDLQELEQRIFEFKKEFISQIPNIKIYFAMKTNHHPLVLQTMIKNGIGIDISSTREFDLAQKAGSKNMIFTGPGKTEQDLSYVLQKDKNIIILMDSFGELYRLEKAARKLHIQAKAGVRIYTKQHGTWNKFGIPHNDLKQFWRAAKKYSNIDLQGIQFHLSWNENATPYKRVIIELAEYLKENFSKKELNEIRFIDFGGGFRPYESEGTYPKLTPQGIIIKTANDFINKPTDFNDKYFISPSIPIKEFAEEIGRAIQTHLFPLVSCNYFTEPGRILSNNAMHVIIKVIDKKSSKNVITSGGINMIGYERFDYDYFPVINLSQSSTTEHPCTIYGNLCMPDDLWGYYYYGKNIDEGDILLVPYQGCLTYSLAQNFIQPIPPVYILE